MRGYVGAIDQGTTSTRFLIFDRKGAIVGSAQKEHEQIYPKPGWVEHNATEIWRNTVSTMADALASAGLSASDLVSVGVTNQRETTLLWDSDTGEPLGNAIVWQDTRTDRFVTELGKDGGQDRLRGKTGLPLATYFSGLKLRWLLENIPGARAKARSGDALFGTIDSWLVWNMTGGPRGGLHITDVTNASRTQMMNLETLDWDWELLSLFDVPRVCLPKIRPSSQIYGEATKVLPGVPIGGILGDQHAALFGQACLKPGEAKNTYGTGCFMLMNTGERMVPSTCGLLTTLGYQLEGQKPVYALEGSIAITGALVQWLRDNLGFIQQSAEIETLARSVDDNGGVVLRARLLGAVRAPLEGACARRDLRPDALREQGAYRACRPGSDGLPDARSARRHGEGFRRCDHGASRRWRHGGERYADAVPGRHSGCARGAPAGDRDDCPWRGLRRRARHRLLAIAG